MISPRVALRALVGISIPLRFGTVCIAVVSVLAVVEPTIAQKYWVNSAGGSFGTSANWSTTSGGTGGAAPPAAGEVANFTLTNTYAVAFGANVTNSGLSVANGTVTLDLNSFDYTITGVSGSTIGTIAAQTGRITVKDGTLGVDTLGDNIVLATAVSSTGLLTVSTGGRLGNGTLDPDIVVGGLGTGTLAFEQNGRGDVAQLNVGQVEGSTGTVTITGPNAVLDASGALNVGLSGTGMLTVQNAGTLTSATTATIGSLVGSQGTLTVAGTGANWTNAGALTIGDAGDAGLSIQSTAHVSTGGPVAIGNSATGTGAAVVTGTDSVWSISDSLNIGFNGTGNMAATSGGQINTTGATIMGNNAGSDSQVVITGAGSRWNSAAVTVGNAGAGALSISAAGVVNTTGNVTLAGAASGTGKATVTGAGSSWNISGTMTVGSLGSGTLTVDSDGYLASGFFSLLDPAGAANGTLNLNGGTMSVHGFYRQASTNLNWTDGTLIVNGGVLNNNGAALTINGANTDDLPALRLSAGATANASNLPSVTIGSNRQGAVIVSGGSNLQTSSATIGTLDGSNGTLLVEGASSTFGTTGDLSVGGGAVNGGGIGTLTVSKSGTVNVGNRLRLWNSALVNMNGGTLIFKTIAPNGGSFNFVSGTVQASANLTANAAVLNTILGTTHQLGTGQRLDVPGNQVNLQSDITVNGGTLSGGILAISSGVNMRVSQAGSATFSDGITNPSGARLFVTDATVTAGTTITNGGELTLSGTSATVNASGVSNSGLITGTGRINHVVANSTVGQIRVTAGQRLEILGGSSSNTNDGLIDVDSGTIEFGRAVINSTSNPSSGMIAARNATLRFNGGLQNSGALTFTEGVSDVFGDVTTANNLSTTGRIIVTGGAQANFFDDVVNNGSIQVSSAGSLQSTAVFLGSLSGNGVTGGGHVFIEGDARPGFSPGTMAFGGDLSFGQLASLDVEIAGLVPGAQYDRVTVAGDASLAGALNVSLLNGFKPAVGKSFAILSAGGDINGEFTDIELPQLSGGLQWGVAYSPQAVSLNVGGVLGDYNLNGTVDAADYAVWRSLLNSNALVADGSGNGIVDQADYDIWRANFGRTGVVPAASSAIAPAVPEPASGILFASVAALLFLWPPRCGTTLLEIVS
jgi:T5SS/PEP-CTERM-associated repeat protein